MKNRKNYIFLYKNIYRNRTLLCVRKVNYEFKKNIYIKAKISTTTTK